MPVLLHLSEGAHFILSRFARTDVVVRHVVRHVVRSSERHSLPRFRAFVRISRSSACDLRTRKPDTTNRASFHRNPEYFHQNDRNYSEPRNAERVVKQAAEFDPTFHLNDNPDATNGPPIIDHAGNVLGGNSRTMTLARVRGNYPEAAADYQTQLERLSKRFGIAPERLRGMENPTLVRELVGEHDPQQAITGFNRTGTAALTTAERAITDSKRLSPETVDYLAQRIDEQGPNGTMAQALEGSGGKDIVNRLVDDGVITTQEKPQFLNQDGSLTPEGKQRIGRLMSGRFFNDAKELEETSPELLAKLDRVVAPLARTASREEWDLTPAVKEAVGILKDAQAHGQSVDDIVRQQGLFGGSSYSDDAVAIARKLEGKPTEITKAFRQYANDEALSRPDAPMTMGFEPPARGDAFEAAFGRGDGATADGTHFSEALPSDGSGKIPRRPGLTADERRVESAVNARVEADPQSYVDRYRRENGNHFSSDLAAKLFPEYDESPDTRAANRRAVGGAARYIADEALRQRLAEMPEGEPLHVVTGGPGAGKSSLVGPLLSAGRTVFDDPITSPDFARGLVRTSLDAGHPVNVTYVDRDPVEAFRGTLQRAEHSETEPGRTVPVDYHARAHQRSADMIQQLHSEFSGNPKVNLEFRQTRTNGSLGHTSLASIASRDYSGVEGELRNELERQYQNGSIGERTYRAAQPAFKGSPALSLREGGQPTDDARKPQVRQTRAQPAVTQPNPPTPGRLASTWGRIEDDFLKALAPAARTQGSRETSYAVREMAAELARRDAAAEAAYADTRKMFASRGQRENWDFMARADSGKPQGNLGLQQIANSMDAMLKGLVKEVQSLGTGKLEHYFEDYFPRYWKDPKAASGFVEKFLNRRPLQGSKSFLKQRTFPTFEDAIKAGMKPVSDNPVDLFLMKVHEMNKYILATRMWQDPQAGVEFFRANERAPAEYRIINDPMATVYGKPTVTVSESYDKPLMDQLNRFARSIGITHDRVTRLSEGPRSAQGFAKPSGEVETKFGSPEQVLIHEIGHIMEDRFGLSRALNKPGYRMELNDLAALRWEGVNPSARYKAYARTIDEKMATAIAAMIYAPERFQKVAPRTWETLRAAIALHPALRPFLDIEKSMTLGTNEAEIPVEGAVIRGRYWAPEDRATVLNNYLSPGLRETRSTTQCEAPATR